MKGIVGCRSRRGRSASRLVQPWGAPPERHDRCASPSASNDSAALRIDSPPAPAPLPASRLPRYPSAMTEHDRLVALLAQRSARRGHFVLSSGRTSTLYIDARLTTMSPEGLATIGPLALD